MKKTISDFLRYLKIPVSASYCEQLIASHPDYPSLLSIVDTLDRLGIPNIAAKVEKEKLPELVFPYILHLSSRQGDFLAIKRQRDLNKNKEKLDDWSGVVLHVAPTQVITDPGNKKYYKRERFYSLLTYVSAIALLLPFTWFAVSTFLLATIGACILIGLVVGYLLVAKDIGIKFDAVESFCTPVGKRNDCERVLESEGASLFGSIKLSDTVFTYFLWQACWFAFLAVIPVWTAAVVQTLSILSIVAIPTVIYSVAYQFKIKTWCKLCLIVDAVLLLQAAGFATAFWGQVDWSWHPTVVVAVIGSGVVIASLVILFKGRMEDVLELRITASEASKVKNSPLVFAYLAAQQEREVRYNSDLHFISGRPDALVKVLMVSNLYCKPCANQHKIVEKLVDTFPDQVSVEFRFIAAKDKKGVVPTTNQYLIEYWMRNIRGLANERESIKKLMLDWYEFMDLEKFRKKYPMQNDIPSEECVALEKEHLDWAARQGIDRTPTTFVNGIMLPKEYLPADLAPLIQTFADGLRRQAQTRATVPQDSVEDLV